MQGVSGAAASSAAEGIVVPALAGEGHASPIGITKKAQELGVTDGMTGAEAAAEDT